MRNYKWRYFSVLCIGLAFILRIFRVGEYPVSLYIDEVAIGYNAHSIVETGRDEWGIPFPTYFRSFDDYKLPLYIYLVAASELVVGKTPLAVRLPSVLAGTATVLVVLMLFPSLGVKKKTTLIAGLLLATLPWHIHFSRGGFEATLGLFLTTWGILLLVKHVVESVIPAKATSDVAKAGIQVIKMNGSRIKCGMTEYLLPFLLLVLSLYSYHSQRIITPLLVLVVLIIYRRSLTRQVLRRFLLPSFLCFILLIPYLLYTFSPQGLARASSETFLADVRVRPDNLFSQKPILAAEHFLRGYVSNFSPITLFFTGDGNGRHGVREIGQLYLWQLPLLLLGVIHTLRHSREGGNPRNFNLLMLFWLLIAPLPAALVRPNPHALRTLPMLIPIIYFIALGLSRITFYVSRITYVKTLVFCFMLFVICYMLLSYLHIYYVHYPRRTEPDWNGGQKETVEYILSKKKDYKEVWITRDFVEGYIFFAYYGDILAQLENIVFLPTKYPLSYEKGILFLAPSGSFAPGKLLTTIHDKSNNPIFDLWEL